MSGRASIAGLRGMMQDATRQQNRLANPGPDVSGPGADSANDPLGIGVQQRGMQAAQQEREQQDPNFISGPLTDPKWAGFFQSMHERGVDKMRGGEGPAGSSQMVGTSMQPGYFSGNSLTGLRQAMNKRFPQPGSPS